MPSTPTTPTPTPASMTELPTSFGALKPVGHVLIALRTPQQQSILEVALQEDGWPPEHVAEFKPRDSVQELSAMLDNAGAMAGFGYEITLMRRYLQLARDGHRWLLVRADDDARAQRVGELARLYGASAAVRYRTFTIEELV
ncbi:MAG: hypothetical protein LCI02_00585 [Proteobacteria bacterium]|nr:hypothetical protein [Pseudomonadota bacterium]